MRIWANGWFQILNRAVRVVMVLMLVAAGTAIAAAGDKALVMRVEGAIGPATADYLHRGLKVAADSGSRLVVLEMDTPGGLDTSMRAIIKDILASTVPVATFVAPGGARAASAGTYILYASHVAAMAPATNLGAATPVAIGLGSGRPEQSDSPGQGDTAAPTLDKEAKPGADGPTPSPAPATTKPAAQSGAVDPMAAKAVKDATAYIRSLAQLRGRNLDFAERAVTEAASLSSAEALDQGVIDLVAADLPALLAGVDGREVKMATGTTVLATAGAAVVRFDPGWRTRILTVLTNHPQVALILMLIGVYGLFFEFSTPGAVIPGVAGAIALLLALYAFHLLPVNWTGVLLLAVGAAMMLAEAFVPSFGAFGIGGILAFVTGGLLLLDTEAPGFGVPLSLIVGLAFTSAVLILAIGTVAARSSRRPVTSGREGMVGMDGVLIGRTEDGQWWVLVRGERWRARCQGPLVAGDRVRVERINGLTIDVVPLEQA